MKTYCDIPTQVVFYDGGDESPIFCTGIAYKDEIICACCGGVIEISEVIADAKEDGIKLQFMIMQIGAIFVKRLWVANILMNIMMIIPMTRRNNNGTRRSLASNTWI